MEKASATEEKVLQGQALIEELDRVQEAKAKAQAELPAFQKVFDESKARVERGDSVEDKEVEEKVLEVQAESRDEVESKAQAELSEFRSNAEQVLAQQRDVHDTRRLEARDALWEEELKQERRRHEAILVRRVEKLKKDHAEEIRALQLELSGSKEVIAALALDQRHLSQKAEAELSEFRSNAEQVLAQQRDVHDSRLANLEEEVKEERQRHEEVFKRERQRHARYVEKLKKDRAEEIRAVQLELSEAKEEIAALELDQADLWERYSNLEKNSVDSERFEQLMRHFNRETVLKAELYKKLGKTEEEYAKKDLHLKVAHEEASDLKARLVENEEAMNNMLKELQGAERRLTAGGFANMSLPTAGCFKKCTQKLGWKDALRRVMTFFLNSGIPENRPDLNDCLLSDSEICEELIAEIDTQRPVLKKRPMVEQLVTSCGLEDDDIAVLLLFKLEVPYPFYRIYNAWMLSNRRDSELVEGIGPIFSLQYFAMSKLPLVEKKAARGAVVKNIPVLKEAFNGYETCLAPGQLLSFWAFASFSTDDKVVSKTFFSGKPEDEAIVYTCGALPGVDMEPFKPEGMKSNEAEILPLCPAVFKVVASMRLHSKLHVTIAYDREQSWESAYVLPPDTKNQAC